MIIKAIGNKSVRVYNFDDLEQYIYLLPKIYEIIINSLWCGYLQLFPELFRMLPKNNCVKICIVHLNGKQILSEFVNEPGLDLRFVEANCKKIEDIEFVQNLGIGYKKIANKKEYDGPKYCPASLIFNKNCPIDNILDHIYRTDKINVPYSYIKNRIQEFIDVCIKLKVSTIRIGINTNCTIDLVDILSIPKLKKVTIFSNYQASPEIILPDMFKADVLTIGDQHNYDDKIKDAHKKYDEVMRFKRVKAIMT